MQVILFIDTKKCFAIYKSFAILINNMKELKLQKPHLILLVGFPGSGKTSFAKHLSNSFSIPNIDAKNLQKKYNLNLKDAKNLTTDFLHETLKAQKTVLVEPVGYKNLERQAYQSIAKKYGYEVVIVWLQAPEETAKKRSLKNGTSLTEFKKKHQSFESPHKVDRHVVLSGMHTHPSQAKSMLKFLTQKISPRTVNVSERIETKDCTARSGEDRIQATTPKARQIIIK